jgi:hypothetical protein
MSQRNNPFSDAPPTKQASKQIAKTYNSKLYDYLQQGNSINFIQAREMGITKLDMNIAEIRKLTTVYSRTVRINTLMCTEYSLQQFT